MELKRSEGSGSGWGLLPQARLPPRRQPPSYALSLLWQLCALHAAPLELCPIRGS